MFALERNLSGCFVMLPKLCIFLRIKVHIFVRRSRKLTKSSPSIWHLLHSVKSTVKISSIFVASIENMNFKKQRIKSEPSDNIYKKWTFQKHNPTSSIFGFLKIWSESSKKRICFAIGIPQKNCCLILSTTKVDERLSNSSRNPKIQQTKMLVTCQRFGDLFLFGLIWQYQCL